MATYYIIDDNEELLETYEGSYDEALIYAQDEYGVDSHNVLDEQEYEDLLNGKF